MKDEQVRELLYQSLETELGGVQVYTTAIRCAENEDLKEEWEEYLEQTKNHVTIMEDVLTKLDLDTKEEFQLSEIFHFEPLLQHSLHRVDLGSRVGENQ